MATQCMHHVQFQDVAVRTSQGREECLELGDTWAHLRLCRECGHVGCCDNAKNKRATQRFHVSNHPIIQSFEPGEDWYWC